MDRKRDFKMKTPADWQEFLNLLIKEKALTRGPSATVEDVTIESVVVHKAMPPARGPGRLLGRLAFLFGRRTREDIEAAILDLQEDVQEMRDRGIPERRIRRTMRLRELKEAASFAWQWIREIRVPGRGGRQ